jgi:hypothetical protein
MYKSASAAGASAERVWQLKNWVSGSHMRTWEGAGAGGAVGWAWGGVAEGTSRLGAW